LIANPRNTLPVTHSLPPTRSGSRVFVNYSKSLYVMGHIRLDSPRAERRETQHLDFQDVELCRTIQFLNATPQSVVHKVRLCRSRPPAGPLVHKRPEQ
jgi:hypothetical protein